MDESRIRLVTNEGISEVPDEFDLSGHIRMRAEQEQQRRLELERQYGDEMPLGVFNPLFVFAAIESLLNMKERNSDAFDALVDKLQNPEAEIKAELANQIASWGSFLSKAEVGILKVDQLTRALFREGEKLEGGFAGFIETKLAQRKSN